MKANSVERTVIIQVIHYRYDNRYLASVLKQYVPYFKGVSIRSIQNRPIIFRASSRRTGSRVYG